MIPEIVSAIAIFSFVPLTIKFCGANVYTICFTRLLISTILILLFWKRKFSFNEFKKVGAWKLILIGVLFFAHWITYSSSIKISSASVCVLGMSTYGIQLIFFGSLFLGHKIQFKNILCLLLVLVGVGFVLPVFDLNNDSTKGLLLALLSASFYSCIPIVLQKSKEFSYEARVFSQFFFSMICFLFFYQEFSFQLKWIDWGALFFLGVFGTFIAHGLWSKVTSRLPTTQSGIIYYSITPISITMSHLFLGEELSARQIFGACVILSGAILNTRIRS